MIIPAPCPFCGRLKGLRATTAVGGKWGFIECRDCGARGPDVRTDYEPVALTAQGYDGWAALAVEKWDHREGR